MQVVVDLPDLDVQVGYHPVILDVRPGAAGPFLSRLTTALIACGQIPSARRAHSEAVAWLLAHVGEAADH